MNRVEAEKPSAIIVYSSFRSSGTWFWSRMRKVAQFRCYYEICHESLKTIAATQIAGLNSSTWRSRHPRVESYLEEYITIVTDFGVPGFPEGNILGERFINEGGLCGPLDADILNYMRYLVECARTAQQIPVLSCTRMIGRSHGIRESFAGYHLMLMRNLFHRWNSYAGQHRTGNDYFLKTACEIAKLKGSDKVIGLLVDNIFGSDAPDPDRWTEKVNYDRLFCFFICSNIYFLTQCHNDVDLIVDINRTAEDHGYRAEIEHRFFEETGFLLDLSNSRVAIDYPRYIIEQPDYCRDRIAQCLERMFDLLDFTDANKCYALDILNDVWIEFARFTLYTEALSDIVRERGGTIS